MKWSSAPVTVFLLALTAGCSPSHSPGGSATHDGSTLSRKEVVEAESVARQTIAEQSATVTSASVIARPGKVTDTNTGRPCTSGRLLRITLIGKFPHVATTGHPVPPGSPTPDFTVRAMVITADAETGRACLIAAQTAENGEPAPPFGSTTLRAR